MLREVRLEIRALKSIAEHLKVHTRASKGEGQGKEASRVDPPVDSPS